MTVQNRGGRIAPDGRPPQAKGVGKNAKRHDLERPKTPGLHGSDLQMGDVQAMEQGQRIAPASKQESVLPGAQGRPQRPASQGAKMSSQGVKVPDAIDFLAKKNGAGFNPPQAQRNIDSSKALTWLPLLRQLAAGPGASPGLVSAFINQARKMQAGGAQPATIVDMHAADDGIEEMLNNGMFK